MTVISSASSTINRVPGLSGDESPIQPEAKRPKPMASPPFPSGSALTVARAVNASSPVLFALDRLNQAKIDPAGRASIKTGIELQSRGSQVPRWQEQDTQVSNLQAAIQGKLGGLPPLEGAFKQHVEGFYGDGHRRSELNKAVPALLAETARQDQGLSEKGRGAVLGLASNDKRFVAVVPSINGYPAKNALFVSERSNFTSRPASDAGNDSIDAGDQPLGQTPGVLVLFDDKGKVDYRELNSQQDAFDLLADPQAAKQLLPHFSHEAQTARTSSNQSRGVPDVFEAFEKGRKGELDTFAFSVEAPKQPSDAASYLTTFGEAYGPENLGDALADYNLGLAKQDGTALLASTADLGLEEFGDILKQVNVAAAIFAPVQAAAPLVEEAEIVAETAELAKATAPEVTEQPAAELEIGKDVSTTQMEPQTLTAGEEVGRKPTTGNGFFNPPKRLPDGRIGYPASPDKPVKWNGAQADGASVMPEKATSPAANSPSVDPNGNPTSGSSTVADEQPMMTGGRTEQAPEQTRPVSNKSAGLQITEHELALDTEKGVFLPKDLSKFKIEVKDGKISWEDATGKRVTSGKIRFVIDSNNDIYVSDVNTESELFRSGKNAENVDASPTLPLRPRLHHGSLVGDEWPIYAGRAEVSDGVIISLNNHTGHFAQPRSTLENVFAIFEAKGVDVKRAKELWFDGRYYNPENLDEFLTLQVPLKDRPNAELFGIYPDSTANRADISPSQYREQVGLVQ
ncbi:hypothetical protein [Ensifer sp. SL37]|uniref:hypothetical protein n=1 Tax=Ensifer sp. SL37 TaxID=2995137 RepID=UPI00227439D4|nr:hypothetical protein [Ensifer sp. SL37]MCY1740762.1 hypothetical protein [Ensifer sp. SL37]